MVQKVRILFFLKIMVKISKAKWSEKEIKSLRKKKKPFEYTYSIYLV